MIRKAPDEQSPRLEVARSRASTRRAPVEQVHQLALKHLKLVYFLAHHAREAVREHVGVEELIAIGSLALVQAANSYDADAGGDFVAFACCWIRGAFKQAAFPRDLVKPKARVQLYRQGITAPRLLFRHPAALRRSQVVDPRPERDLAEVDSTDAVESMLSPLPARHRRLMRLRYEGDHMIRDAARAMRLKFSRAFRMHAYSLRAIRLQLSG